MTISIRPICPKDAKKLRDDLASILHEVVHEGGSVGFVLPFSLDDARQFWTQNIFPGHESGQILLYGTWCDDHLVGTGQLVAAAMPNQAHRMDLAKLLVHPNFRRRGIARRLMQTLIDRARSEGKKLLTLDTRTGDSAEPLYFSMGFQIAGTVPDFCRTPEGDHLEATTYMYKKL